MAHNKGPSTPDFWSTSHRTPQGARSQAISILLEIHEYWLGKLPGALNYPCEDKERDSVLPEIKQNNPLMQFKIVTSYRKDTCSCLMKLRLFSIKYNVTPSTLSSSLWSPSSVHIHDCKQFLFLMQRLCATLILLTVPKTFE